MEGLISSLNVHLWIREILSNINENIEIIYGIGMENKIPNIKFNNKETTSKFKEKDKGTIKYKGENKEIYESNISEPNGLAT